MIALHEITKSFAGNKILYNISAEINDGEFVVITGKSGSGKTTLLNIIGLLETPDEGTVSIDGKLNFSRKNKRDFYRHNIGFLFQNFALIDNESVQTNLEVGTAYLGISKKDQRDKIHDVLASIGLPDFEKKKIYQLSGGEQQRIALARIILKKPRYICADEPTGNLDTENRDLVFSYLKSLHEQGRTIVMVTHDHDLACANCVDRVIEL